MGQIQVIENQRTHLYNTVITMVANGLGTQGAITSAYMVLNKLPLYILVLASHELTLWSLGQVWTPEWLAIFFFDMNFLNLVFVKIGRLIFLLISYGIALEQQEELGEYWGC